MTRRSEYKLPPRMGPAREAAFTLHAIRNDSRYGSGELIAAAAEASVVAYGTLAFNRRQRIRRASQQEVFASAQQAVEQAPWLGEQAVEAVVNSDLREHSTLSGLFDALAYEAGEQQVT